MECGLYGFSSFLSSPPSFPPSLLPFSSSGIDAETKKQFEELQKKMVDARSRLQITEMQIRTHSIAGLHKTKCLRCCIPCNARCETGQSCHVPTQTDSLVASSVDADIPCRLCHLLIRSHSEKERAHDRRDRQIRRLFSDVPRCWSYVHVRVQG